ncbi:hypothetical protein [Xanthomonas campestris]|uniref:hypothetical protein n=1 Tax=Xanthomonas campestris TaxID=339 RepID=UPI000E325D42|nr:hypothetical protein [Xanthomonas campestris]RFF46164.1 hypothetical protein D0A35_18680 [Xanthomonas campestris]
MDTAPSPSAFAQLRTVLATSTDPWTDIEQLQADLVNRYPSEATEVIEMISSWLYQLGAIGKTELIGFV